MDEATLEFFVRDSFFNNPTDEQLAKVVELMEPYRETIEDNMMDGYEPDTMSWRDYRNAMWSSYKELDTKIDVIMGES